MRSRAALGDEASGPRGALLPVPNTDGEDLTVEKLKADITGLAGSVALVESMSRGWAGDGSSTRPTADWAMKRLGADPPASLVSLEERVALEAYSASGVPPSLFLDGDGIGRGETYRRLLHLTVVPLARIVEAELSEKLDGEVRLSFDSLFAADLSGWARAFQSMVDGGMAVEKAAVLAGLMESEG